MTAYADHETIQRAEYSGAYGYVLKPFRIQELDATIRVALQKHAQQSEAIQSLQTATQLSSQLQQEIEKISLQMSGRAQEVALEADLHQALTLQELQVHYQPLINLTTQEVVGAEALLRWRHPKIGLIPPTTFIPLAEKNQLIEAIGAWVLQEACTQAKSWQTIYPTPLKLSVNVSPYQFRQGLIATNVIQALERTGLLPELLTLEITETALMNPNFPLLQTIHTLKELKVQLSFDDFGTGYSSLSYLQKFPFDMLKIDRSFIQNSYQDASKSAIIQAITQLAKSFQLDIIAEGVELPEEAQYLLSQSCHLAQGFLYSPPLPGQEFKNFLRTHRQQHTA
ncbi:MAG: EAL domain-containing protein [Leptolyngbyaceae cyanobacterium SM2_3_12]|nr:EAL domain-containing protein [Leptolyngbyaceae cyanobacterium SM2_3_12]